MPIWHLYIHSRYQEDVGKAKTNRRLDIPSGLARRCAFNLLRAQNALQNHPYARYTTITNPQP